jgi:glycosyltransferase involved in cell wall biosynthesis
VGDAGLTFDPADQGAVTAAVARLLGDPELAAELRERGRARAEGYTWQATARATLAAYEAAIDVRAAA